ncbi:uncharacterized protein LOC114351734 [Ostrinia furnacalis]|uniref:uncharacterized protein LOC114351734 n=1 Tax=Ostrinia furnacalis TaxID=93504 RepID=UPI00103A11F4|nr:uncharacterized protein LOC114351734 [Ostrinia furnacalis]
MARPANRLQKSMQLRSSRMKNNNKHLSLEQFAKQALRRSRSTRAANKNRVFIDPPRETQEPASPETEFFGYLAEIRRADEDQKNYIHLKMARPANRLQKSMRLRSSRVIFFYTFIIVQFTTQACGSATI